MIAARFLGPHRFGEASLLLYAAGLVLVLGPASVGPNATAAVAGRLARGVPGISILPASILLTGLVVVPIAGVFIVAPNTLHAFVGIGNDATIRVTGLVILGIAASQILRSGLEGFGRPVASWAVLAAIAVASPAATLFLGAELTVSLFLLISLITQGVGPAIAYLVLLRRRVVWEVRRQDLVSIAQLSWPLAVWGGSLVLGQWLGRRTLATGGELEQVGLFHAATVVQQPFVIGLTALSATLLPALSRERATRIPRSLARRVFWGALGLGLLANGALVSLAMPLMTTLYGDAYADAAPLVPVIVFAAVLMVLGNVLGQQLIADERVRTGMVTNIAWLVAFVIVLAFLAPPSPMHVAIAMVLAEAVHTALVLAATWRSAGITTLDIAVVGAVGVVLALQSTVTSLAVPLTISGLVGWAILAMEPISGRPWSFSFAGRRRD